MNRLVRPLVGYGAAGPVGGRRDLPVGSVAHTVTRVIAAVARPGQEIGVGRTLDGQERADGIE